MRWCTQILFVTAVAFGSLAAWCVWSLPELTAPANVRLNSPSAPILMEVIEQRYLAADELLAGRKTLPETIARFRALADDDPLDVVQALRGTLPDASTEDDLFFMQVYHYAETQAQRLELDDSCLQPLRRELQRRQALGTLKGETPSTTGAAVAS